MFAEQVFDGSFEGVPALPCRIPQGHGSVGEAVVSGRRGPSRRLRPRPIEAFNGKVSQRITQKPGDPCTLGVSQVGKHVKAGEPLRCSLYLRPGTPVAGAGGDLGAWSNLRERGISTRRSSGSDSRRSSSPPARILRRRSRSRSAVRVRFGSIRSRSCRPTMSSAGGVTWPRPSRPSGPASFVSAAARPKASSGPPPSATRPNACRLRPVGAGWNRATRAWRSSSSFAVGSVPSP